MAERRRGKEIRRHKPESTKQQAAGNSFAAVAFQRGQLLPQLGGDKASDTMTGLAVGGGTEVDWGAI